MATPTKQPTRKTGLVAEKLACQYLEAHKLKLIKSNYHCRMGEIDLIMQDQSAIVFVEVRYRKSDRYGSPESTVTTLKQRKLIRAAQHFLLTNPKYQNAPCRFDVVGITPNNEGTSCNWIKNAFQSF